jgi:PAS domain S-box-containing protein
MRSPAKDPIDEGGDRPMSCDEALRLTQAQSHRQLAEIETIYRSAPIGLCVFDTELRWVRLNQAIADINGVSIEEHIGRTPREVVPDIGEQAETALRKILETGEPLLDFEMNGTTRSQPGVLRHWKERWVPIKDEQGQIIGISVAAEEITQR